MCRFVTCSISPQVSTTIHFGVDRFEGEEIPSSAYSLGSTTSFVWVDLGVSAEGEKVIAKDKPTVEERLLSKDKWFEDECMDLGIGVLWLGLLSPSSAYQPFSFHSAHGRNILDPCPARGDRDTSHSTPTLIFSTALWQTTFDLHQARLKTKDPAKAKATDRSQNVERAPDLQREVVHRSVVVRKMFRHIMRTTLLDMGLSPGAKTLSSCNLWDVVKAWGADTMVLPTSMQKEHWIFVAVTGLAGVLPALDKATRWSSADSSGSEPKLRIMILDSLEHNAVTEGRRVTNTSGPTMSTKTNTPTLSRSLRRRTVKKPKSLQEVLWTPGWRSHTIASVVIYALATEWVMKDQPSIDFCSAAEFVQESEDAYTSLMRFVSLSAPAVPQQKDSSQCGPMAILAMQAFCENELFRNYCLGCSDFCSPPGFVHQPLASSQNRPGSASDTPPEAYSFETAFELRGKLIHFVRQVKHTA